MAGPEDSTDLTARFNALREVLEKEIRGSQELAAARMDGMDAARTQYLGSLQARGDFIQEDMNRRFGAVQSQLDQRLAAYHQTYQDLRVMLDERYATQTKALDAAFRAAEQAVAVALANAEKAVAKAETAADKRFDAVNEFRQSLADQTAAFLTRNEYTTAHTTVTDTVADLRSQLDNLAGTVVPRNETDAWRNGLTSKLDDGIRNLSDRTATLELRLTSRLDLSAGQQGGAAASKTEQRLGQGAVISLSVGVLVFLGLVVSTITLIVHH
jgi:hypothetical protein